MLSSPNKHNNAVRDAQKLGVGVHKSQFIPKDAIQVQRNFWDDTVSDFIVTPRLNLPTKGIDQWATLVNLEAMYSPLPASSFFDEDMSIDLLTTLIMPKVQPVKKVVAPPATSKTAMEGYKTQMEKLLKTSGVYVLASLASPLVSLIMAPFLTRTLSHEDYGVLAVLNTAIALLAGLTQLGLGSAFFRSYNYDYETKKDRLSVLSTTVWLLMLIAVPTLLVTVLTAPWLTTELLASPSSTNALKVGALVVFLQNLTVPCFSWLRAESRAGYFATLSIANLLVNLATTLLFVGLFHMGVGGSLLGTGCGYAVIIVCVYPFILFKAGLTFRRDIAKGLLSFGLPNVTNFISVWVLQLSDRYLLSHFGSLTQTASYAVAYSLGGILSVVVLSPFSLAWPSAMFAIAKRDDAPYIFQLVFRWYTVVLLITAFSLSFVCTVVLNLFFPANYQSAALIIPIIALSTLFYGVYSLFTTGISIQKKTWYAVIFTTVSALSNIGFNLVLIPLYGAMGATLSTLLAYVLLALVAYVANQRFYPIPFEVGKFALALLVGVGFYLGSIILARGQNIYVGWGITLALLLLYSLCLLLFVGYTLLLKKIRSLRKQGEVDISHNKGR